MKDSIVSIYAYIIFLHFSSFQIETALAIIFAPNHGRGMKKNSSLLHEDAVLSGVISFNNQIVSLSLKNSPPGIIFIFLHERMALVIQTLEAKSCFFSSFLTQCTRKLIV